MTRFSCLLALLLLAVGAHAQDLPLESTYNLGEVVALPHRTALEATLRRDFNIAEAKTAVWWAGFSGDPSLRPLLRQIVEGYTTSYSTITAAAYASLAMLGEPPAYFLDIAARHLSAEETYYSALDAANALFVYSDPDLADAFLALGPVPTFFGETGTLASNTLVLDELLAGGVAARSSGRPSAPVYNEIASLVVNRLRTAYGGKMDFYGTDSLRVGIGTTYHPALDEYTLYGLGRLQRLGASVPDSIRAYLPAALAADAAFIQESRLSVEAVQQWAMKAALPHEPFPAPPADPAGDVAPVLECVRDEPGGGLTARFGYDNRTGAEVSVPYGPANWLVVGAGPPLTRQPSAFGLPRAVDGQPGRTPPLGFAVVVEFTPGETVTWTLPGGTATATASSPRCGETPPVAPTCNGLAATVYVADGRVVGGPLGGQPYAGRLVGSDGPDVIAGTDAADLLDGGSGDDTLCGGAGDDAFVGGPGADTALGGDGADGCDAETATACAGPVPALADVRPVLECVRAEPGGALTAFFGYENRSGRPGRRAYGSANRLTPAALDGRQPQDFALPGVVAGRPGRTPFYPGSAFTVPFAPGQTVVWRLGSRTSTASASSARCPD